MSTPSAVSARKLQANRMNASRSTGPKTAAGKARSAANAAVTHGFYSTKLLLDGEDERELEALRQELLIDLHPRGSNERLIVERLTALHWKLRRLHAAEQRMLEHQLGLLVKHQKPADATPEAALAAMIYDGVELERLSIYERRLDGSIHRCLRELRLLRKDREQHQPAEPMAEAQATDDDQAALAPSPLAGEGGGEGKTLSTSNEYRVKMRSDAQASRDTRYSSPTAALSPHPNPLPQGERGPRGAQNMRGEPTAAESEEIQPCMNVDPLRH